MEQRCELQRRKDKEDERTVNVSEYIKRIIQRKAPQERDRNIPYTETPK